MKEIASLDFLSKRVSVLFAAFSKYPDEEAFEGYLRVLKPMHITEDEAFRVFDVAMSTNAKEMKVPSAAMISEIVVRMRTEREAGRTLNEMKKWTQLPEQERQQCVQSPEWQALKTKLASK